MALVSYPEILPNERDSKGDNPQQKHLAEYYTRLGAWCNSAFEEAEAAQKDVPEIKQIATALEYLGGQQWKDSGPAYKSKPVSNETLSMFWEAIGLLTDTKPMFQIKDGSGSGQYSQIEDNLNKMGKTWASQARFNRSLAFCTMFGMLTSAPAKIYWNPFAKGTSGDPADGDISFEHCPVQSLLRLGINSLDDIQEDECVIYKRSRTLEWIKRAYPRMGKLVTPQELVGAYTASAGSSINVAPNFYPPLSAGMRRMMGMSTSAPSESVYPRADVLEFWMKDATVNESRQNVWMGPRNMAWGYWVKPGQMLYPRGRLVARSNDVTLYDEPNPYFHRKYPFSLLGLYAVPWQQYAMSVISPWMTQQDILNQIMSGVLQCIKKAVNPPLIAAKSAIHPEALRAIDSSKPNLKISYNQNAPAPPSWGQPPNVPGYVFQGYSTILTSMRQMSAGSAMDAAAGKKQVPGSDTLDRMTFSKTTPIRLMGRNIEDFVDDVGTMWCADALQFYDAAQRIEMLGEKGLVKEDLDDKPGSMIPEGINSEAFVRRWKFKTDKGTLLNVQRQDKLQIAFALRKNHDISRDQLFDILDWNINRKENQEQLQKEAEDMAKAQAAAGAKPGGHKK